MPELPSHTAAVSQRDAFSAPPVGNGAERELARLFAGNICESWWSPDSNRGKIVSEQNHAAIHEAALLELSHAVRNGDSLILLRSAHAGFGKTHLLSQWCRAERSDYLFTSLSWESSREGRLTLQQTAVDLLGRLAPADAAKASCGVLATLLSRLIQQGRVPCANRTQVVSVLNSDPELLLAQSGQAKAMAEWFQAQFEALVKPMAHAVASGDSASHGVLLESWLHRLWQAARQHSVSSSDESPIRILQQGVQSDASARQLLELLCQWKPLVLIADHLDCLIAQPQACADLSSLSLMLSHLPRAHVILSVNDDWWQNVLTKNLPSAVKDRLDSGSIVVPALAQDAALNLLRSRLQAQREISPDIGEQFLQALPLERYFAEQASISCRDLLRWVNPQWKTWLQSRPQPVSTSHTKAAVASIPMPALTSEAELEEEEAMEKLASHLEQEAKGRSVDLSGFEDDLDTPPPGVVPLPKPAWQGSFLVEDADRKKVSRAPSNAKPGPVAFSDTRQSVAADAAMIGQKPAAGPNTPGNYAPNLSLLQARFIQWRTHLMQKGEVPELEESGFRDLLSLTGLHFPMIRHEETELPGLSGQAIPRWLLQGQEIVFGLPAFQQREQWRMLGSFTAGRLAEIEAAATQYGEPMTDLKWVVFIQQQTAMSWQSLKSDGTLPVSLEGVMDTILLSPAEQVDLVALHTLMLELAHKSSTASNTPNPNMDAAMHDLISSKLAPLWRRITRPLTAGVVS